MPNWKPVKTNLWRNEDSGIYYAVVKIKGERKSESLKTKLRTVADLLLPKKLNELRAAHGAPMGPSVTLGECAEEYLRRKEERGYRRRNRQGVEQAKSKPLKERSMDYRKETIEPLRRAFGNFDEHEAALVTEVVCHQIAQSLRKTKETQGSTKYSPSRFNGIIQTLRGILDIAVENGALPSNPANCISFLEVKPSDKPIPTREQVTEILRLLDADPQRRFARLSLRAMAFTGLRPNEARHLTAADVNLKAGTLTARETKNGKPRTIQLIVQALDLFNDEGVDKVLAALKKDPRRAIRTIGNKIGVKMTPYTMRHLHMTALVESGVDLPTAALISGHQDRGVTLLRHYLHARPEHVRKQLTKVVI